MLFRVDQRLCDEMMHGLNAIVNNWINDVNINEAVNVNIAAHTTISEVNEIINLIRIRGINDVIDTTSVNIN